MSNTKYHTKPYGQTAAFARRLASLEKKVVVRNQKRIQLRKVAEANPTEDNYEKYECADIAWENAVWALRYHNRSFFDLVY